ncbi:hypothetical protein [Mycobacterium montefiorense]|uniref:Secreted protein n=2 Tax=Mycobacterium montefiorense TaxID=154654 RepID=A0ABQ0NMW8_9MYCO|nr:hypothetical protein [Mycobacterium montefiorense]GBG38263.1 hypothetical protein MmonteBS_26350 [Mycobacterium montefiorense]GKU42457.1 hypothetical protein NJB14192_44400 [Mycobacterium montefiorense]GKU59228.1 hypothetical protein NJB14197_50880 [Mycobacterium montefiorense]
MSNAQEGHPGRLWMPRSRGAVCGLILVVLGAWGALIPFVGPHFNFAYTPDQDWAWSTARGWLEVLPGGIAALGGLLLIFSGNRITAIVGGWLAVLAGGWFVIGGEVAPLLGIGSAGDPIAVTERKRAALEISYFSGLGVLIVFVSGIALARLAVRLASDIEALARVRSATPVAGEPVYMSGLEEPHREVEADAMTTPRADHYESSEEPKTGGWRKQRTDAAPAKGASYLRWPHPQR